MSTDFLFLNDLSFIFDENFIISEDYLLFNNIGFLLQYWNHSPYDLVNFLAHATPYTKTIIAYINQFEDLNLFNNTDNITAVYHYSIPNTKLAYPEPFIASPSFMHSDLWFVHILVYQYWLWFVFVFIIVFFFITFICTVRWCNMRVRPRRETRGVSRSKCGDLITACVPVTWATSIIVSESTDAIDYYDGFGTTELVVGIRAYQWGWEYYYPKDIDLNYNIKQNYSSFIGNSLKYTKTTDVNLKANNMWRFYQNKISDQIITPAHTLVLPSDNSKLMNFLNINDFGANSAQEPNSFKRIREFSKISNLDFISFPNQFALNYATLNSLYVNNLSYTDSYLYGLKRQHNFLSNNASLNNHTTLFNSNNILKILIDNNHNSFFNPNCSIRESTMLNPHFIFGINKTDLISFINFFQEIKPQHSIPKESIFFKKMFNSLIKQNVRRSNTTLDTTIFSKLHPNMTNLFIKTNWLRPSLLKFSPEYPYSPIFSNHPSISTSSLITTHNEINDNVPPFFKKTTAVRQLSFDFRDRWDFFWSNSIVDWRLYNLYNHYSRFGSFYFPLFDFYYDYDFRNWQSLEFLEDFFWESIDSVYLYDEYVNMKASFDDYSYFDKNENLFNIMNRVIFFKDKISAAPFFTNSLLKKATYANPVYLDDFVNTPSTLTTKDFFIFPIATLLNSLEDSYEASKFLNYFTTESNKPMRFMAHNGLLTHTHFHVFDFFRSDVDDFSWFSDDNFFNLNKLSGDFTFTKLVFNNLWCAHYDKNVKSFLPKELLLPNYWMFNENSNIIDFSHDFTNDKLNRFSNHLNVRGPVKNSIVTYNAILKIFRARFDENRSNAKLVDFSRSASHQPLITASRLPYEKILGKTKENFFQINLYKNNFRSLMSNLHNFHTSLNYYFFDFPFLLAMKSDASRYLWFDWFTKWGFYEIQPSSSSRYAIYGMPYFSKNFEFSTSETETLTETETYFLRLTRARRNYIPNWTYTPYIYSRNTYWYKNNLVSDILSQLENQLNSSYVLLKTMNWFWSGKLIINNNSLVFNPSHSTLNNYAKLGWKPQAMAQSYYYNVANLVDILTKREFLYRELFSLNNKLISLPNYLTNSPANPIVDIIKSSFLFIDPLIISSEYSRDHFAMSLGFFNSAILKTMISSCNNYFNFKIISDYFFYYLFYENSLNVFEENQILQKSQYRPLRKGINNMIRLHATGAVALPIEIRIQVLASSKDVIHSWAIPSAGIKIDCVPGYSSHRVMIFLLSGIFWGQCMEICGRYHHWMPIIIYFMKRDLFFLWCTHFVFLTGANNMWTINDRPYTDYVRLASFDKYSWLNELTTKSF